jgi:DNA-binding MarR family transcriptional regulator
MAGPRQTPSSIDDPTVQCAIALLTMAAPFTGFLQQVLKDQPAGQRITTPQFRALVVVAGRPGISLSELAEEMGVSKPTTSVFILRMYQIGLLHKDPHEKRAVRLHLTQKGQGIHDALIRELVVRLGERLITLEASDIKRIHKTAEQLTKLLGE